MTKDIARGVKSKLVRKVLGYAAIAGTLAVSAISLGCATSHDSANLGLAAQIIGITNPNLTPPQDATLGAIATYAYNNSQNQSRKEAIQELNSRVNNSQVDISLEYKEPKLIAFTRWVDKNHDGKVDDIENELIGKDKREFNLKKEDLYVMIHSGDYEGNAIFRAFNSKGKLIGIAPPIYIPKNGTTGFGIGPKIPISSNFMNDLEKSGPGLYTITTTLDNGRVLAMPLMIK